MNFNGIGVPGAEWVEIVHIREKDGSPLAPENWRHKLFGRISLCWIAGGLRKRGAYFLGKIRIENGEIVEWDTTNERWTSTTKAQPVEVEPGVFDLETNTCIYRFRILTDGEEELILVKYNDTIREKLAAADLAMASPAGGGELVS